jgi:hypothetical protein
VLPPQEQTVERDTRQEAAGAIQEQVASPLGQRLKILHQRQAIHHQQKMRNRRVFRGYYFALRLD